MKVKNDKNMRPRTIVNTCLLTLAAVVFGIMTYMGTSQIKMSSKNFLINSESPALCFEKEYMDEDGRRATEGAYICSTEMDSNYEEIHLTDPEDYTMFLYNELVFSSIIRSNGLIIVVSTIGYMFAIASLIGAVVYWNHNRN